MHPQVLLAYGSPVAAALPRRWAESLAATAGNVAWHLSPRARQQVDTNLRQVLGSSVPEHVHRSVFQSYARYYLGMMRLAHRSPETAVGRTQLFGSQAVEESLGRRRGALLLGAHLGHWDVAAIAAARRFGRLWVYVEPLQPQTLRRFYTRVRPRHGLQVLHVGERTRAPQRALRRNELLGMLVDRPFGARSAAVPFGAGNLHVPTGGVRLALRFGAGIHAVFAFRQGAGYRVEMSEDLACLATAASLQERVRQVAMAFAASLRGLVARVPEQWCLLHPLQPGAGPWNGMGRQST